MSKEDPITIWLNELRQSDENAAHQLWKHFAQRLYEAARGRLNSDSKRVYDEEDAAQSAFRSLCVGVAEGRFPDLNDRDSLWRLMLTITFRKVHQRHRYDGRQQRDIQKTLPESVFLQTDDAKRGFHPLSKEPTPEFATEFADLCESMFGNLDGDFHTIAQLKMESHTDDEIAARLGCSRRTVQRRLEMIRRRWQNQVE